MYEIRKALEENYENMRSFLSEVPSINQIDDEVLKNAIILFLDDKIHGMISYESFFNYALIRYFVFKRGVDEMIIKELFDTMEELILENDIEYIFSLVNQNEVFDLFTNLKFEEVNEEEFNQLKGVESIEKKERPTGKYVIEWGGILV